MTISSNVSWQCRRGMLELDILLQRILEKNYDTFSADEKKLFSQLLKQDDPTLYDWLIADVSCTDKTLQLIVQLIRKIVWVSEDSGQKTEERI